MCFDRSIVNRSYLLYRGELIGRRPVWYVATPHLRRGFAASNLHLISHFQARLPPLLRDSLALRLHRLPAGTRTNWVRVQRQEGAAAVALIHVDVDRGIIVKLEPGTTVRRGLGMGTVDALTKRTGQTEVHDAGKRRVLRQAT